MGVILPLILAALAAVAQNRDGAARPAGAGVIAGRVLDATSGQRNPVRRATITIQSSALAEPQITFTDPEGRYRISDLPAGVFTVTPDKDGFVVLNDGPPGSLPRPPAIELAAGQSAALDLLVEKASAIDGRIQNVAGQPLAGAIVSAVRFTYGPAGRRPGAVRQVITDDRGRFRVHTLPAGVYYLAAAPAGLPRTYFPGSARAADARAITLGRGEEASGIDFALMAVPLAAVAGRVIDSSGRTLTSFSLRLQEAGLAPGDLRAVLTGNGFHFQSVTPGDYWLLASAVTAPGRDPEVAAIRLGIAGQDVADMTVPLSAGATIGGRLMADPSARAPAGVRLLALDTAYDMPVPAGAPATSGLFGADGTCTLGGLIGPRLLRLEGLPANWAIASIHLDDLDVTDKVFEFNPGARHTVRVTITSATGSVGGLVSQNNQPTRARIVVFSADEAVWGARSRFIKTFDVPASGRYAVDGLLPGRYLAVAVPHLDDGMWDEPETLRALRAVATPLEVKAGDRLTLPLTLTLAR